MCGSIGSTLFLPPDTCSKCGLGHPLLSKIRDGAQKEVRLDCGVLGAYDGFFVPWRRSLEFDASPQSSPALVLVS